MNMVRTYTVVLMVGLSCGAGSALGQEGRPSPEPPTQAAQPPDAAVEVEADPRPPERTADGRRPDRGDLVVLAFDNVSIEDTIPFIVQTTGKVVMPVNLTTLKAKKVTLINDEPIDRMRALDLLIEAFRLNDVGVAEHEDRIIIAMLSEMPDKPTPVFGPDDDLMGRTDRGTIITKIFSVKNTDAESLAEQLRDPMPDYASIAVDVNSNQILVLGDVGLCQRLGRLIAELDRNYVQIKTQTFRLAHADANEISQNILDLFEDTGTARTGTTTAQRTSQSARQRRTSQRGRQVTPTRDASGGPGPTAELRMTVNTQQNSVTVSG